MLFVFLNRFATLLHRCLNSVKKGSAKEISLASHAIGIYLKLLILYNWFSWLCKRSKHCCICIGLLALTAGMGEKAQEILEESVTPISEALRSRSEASKIASVYYISTCSVIYCASDFDCYVIVYLVTFICSYWMGYLWLLLLVERNPKKLRNACKLCGKWFTQNLVPMYVSYYVPNRFVYY